MSQAIRIGDKAAQKFKKTQKELSQKLDRNVSMPETVDHIIGNNDLFKKKINRPGRKKTWPDPLDMLQF